MRTLLSALFLSLLLATTSGLAQKKGRWINLGSLHVSDRAERDTLNVGVKRGRFEAVRLGAKGRAIQFHDVKIHFENGDVQDVQLRNVVKAGEWTRAIDLQGGDRNIDKIVLKYDAQTARRGKGATVLVRGRR